jgi:molybdate transport system ATP-binding protein
MSFEVRVRHRFGDTTVSAEFITGEGVTVLFGASGAGKSSVLKMVAGLLAPEPGGLVRVAGKTLYGEGLNLPPEQRRAGVIFQDGRLFPHMSVQANLNFGLKLRPTEQRWMSQAEAIAFLGIGSLLERKPATLSGGEAQRVAIGRALLSAPRFLLMDEPLSSLDSPRREEILRVIERIRDELKLPILYVTHDQSEVDRLANHIVRMG